MQIDITLLLLYMKHHKKPKFTDENMKKVDRLNWSYILPNPLIPVLPHSSKAPAVDIGVLLIYLLSNPLIPVLPHSPKAPAVDRVVGH